MSDTPSADAAMVAVIDAGGELAAAHRPLIEAARDLDRACGLWT
jgi:hypothetical protein